jgi:hypothetical protein
VKRPKSIAFTLECAGRQKRGSIIFFGPPGRLKYTRNWPELHSFAYSTYDPLRLSPELVAVLPHFDGRPSDEVLEEIRVQRGIRLDPALAGCGKRVFRCSKWLNVANGYPLDSRTPI